MKITRRQLRQIIGEEQRRRTRILREEREANPTIQGVDPLIDGLNLGNGVVPELFGRESEVMDIMQSNSDNPVYALALKIIQTRKPVPYLPFRFDDKLLKTLQQDGLDYETVMNLKYNMNSEDYEHRPAGW